MPYNPQAIGEEERSYAYRFVPACGAAVVLGLITHLTSDQWVLPTAGAGLGAAGLCMSAFPGQYDEYFRTLCAVGHRWLAASLALALFGWCLMGVVGLSYGAGVAVGSEGAVTRFSSGLASVDAYTLIMIAALIFHAGFTFAWVKATWWTERG
ncbi:MAG: hypothetical protein ACJLS3_04605 [Erythrobacter sp.]